MSRRNGFTLMELLVVVSIVTLLASLMVPAISKVKMLAKDSVCQSQLHQFGQIWNMYVAYNDGQFMERGSGYSYGAVSWFHCIRQYYYQDPELLFCPQAKQTIGNGGRNPYMAWDNTTDFGAHYEGSYGINLYVSRHPEDPEFWGTPNLAGTSNVPLQICSQWKDIQPFPGDEPLPYESDVWTGGPYHEMRRPCIKRHAPYYVNVLFLDFSVDKRTIKELWRLKWHKYWPAGHPLPVWPDWMADVPEPD